MRENIFKAKAVKNQENMAETIFAFVFLIIFIYLMIGIPVWIQIIQGHEVVSPGILYEPIVKFFRS